MRLEPRAQVPLALSIAAPLSAIVLALVLSALPLAWAGAPVLAAYAPARAGCAGSLFALTETLARATPLILTGLAAAVAFRARLWNIGGEGQLYAGALAATVLGSGIVALPAPLTLPAVLIGGAAAGAVLLLVPTLLKVRLGVDEVVTTLLLNFVVLLFVQMMLEGPLKDPMGMGWPQSPPVLPEAELPKLVARTRLHLGLVLGAPGRHPGLALHHPDGGRLRGPRGRRQHRRRALRRHAGGTHLHPHGASSRVPWPALPVPARWPASRATSPTTSPPASAMPASSSRCWPSSTRSAACLRRSSSLACSSVRTA